MRAANRQKLLAWSLQHNVMIIENDASFTLGFAQEVVPPLSVFYPHENIIYLYNLAELTGNNTHLSLMLAPPHLLPSLEKIKNLLTSEMPSLGVNMIGAFLGSPYLMRYLASTLKMRKERLSLALEGLKQRFPHPQPWGLLHAGFFSFAAKYDTELLDSFCYPLQLFYQQEPSHRQQRYVYPVGTLSLQEIEAINKRLQ